jgi:UDP-N-acetylmuramyl pentapeptide phosphotransferase/UDP-N-acetylglucosamine-1-phosphate transferase
VDEHKPGKPLVPTGYGIYYAVVCVCFWFILVFLEVRGNAPLLMATSVLFGSTMGLFDDFADLRWRYKAALPVFAALPYVVIGPTERTTVSILWGSINFGGAFLLLFVPVMVTIVTNSYNQLGGLNGLEAGTGLIVLCGIAVVSRDWILLGLPILVLALLTYLSFTGRVFIGNVGSFSIGLTLAVASIIDNLKLMLLISMVPFIANSILILYSNYIIRDRAITFSDNEGKLYAHKIRSLRTLLLRYRHMSEKRIVLVLYSVVLSFVAVAVFIEWL